MRQTSISIPLRLNAPSPYIVKTYEISLIHQSPKLRTSQFYLCEMFSGFLAGITLIDKTFKLSHNYHSNIGQFLLTFSIRCDHTYICLILLPVKMKNGDDTAFG